MTRSHREGELALITDTVRRAALADAAKVLLGIHPTDEELAELVVELVSERIRKRIRKGAPSASEEAVEASAVLAVYRLGDLARGLMRPRAVSVTAPAKRKRTGAR